jgi:uncharacterized protein YrzB (UPF0473 family)
MKKIEIGEVLTINDENNQEQEVEVLGVANVEGTEYVAISFVEDITEESEDDIDVFFLKVDENGVLEAIESDEEFEKISIIFDETLDKEEFALIISVEG